MRQEEVRVRNSWIGPILVGLIVYVGLKFLPSSIKGYDHALIAAGIAFVASILVRGLSFSWK